MGTATRRRLLLKREDKELLASDTLNEMEKAGYFAGLYMSASPLTTLTTDGIKKRYAIWVAHYGVSKPSYNGQYGMWQKSSTGKVNGISGNVDMDYAYVDFAKLIKDSGLNFIKDNNVIGKQITLKIGDEFKVTDINGNKLTIDIK